MRKIVRRGLWGLGVIILIAQFVRPDRTNPPVQPGWSVASDSTVPVNVTAILRHSCFDCHSNETEWPWYSNVTPVNFMLVRDVSKGRRNVNFSEWGKYKASRRQSLSDQINDQVSHGDMPLAKYLIMHPDARLSQQERKTLLDWTDALQKMYGDPDSQ
jgi:hypothetical protein